MGSLQRQRGRVSGGGGAAAKREYRCATEGCTGVVAVSAVKRGVVEGVCCPVCGRVQSVFLGGYHPGGEPAARRAGRADPRNPPIERGPVRPWRRG